jgi:hypothetical protein
MNVLLADYISQWIIGLHVTHPKLLNGFCLNLVSGIFAFAPYHCKITPSHTKPQLNSTCFLNYRISRKLPQHINCASPYYHLQGKTICLYSVKSRDSSVGIALGYGLDDRGFEFRQGLGIFFFTTISRPILWPTQSPIQWVPGTLSMG